MSSISSSSPSSSSSSLSNCSSSSSSSSSCLSFDMDELSTASVSNEDSESTKATKAAKAAELAEKRRKKLELLFLDKMPVQCFDNITSHLDFKDVLSLSLTCKRVRYMFRSLYEGEISRRVRALREITESACDSYGALADCEKETNNAKKLIRFSSATMGMRAMILPSYMFRGGEYLLQFDSEGVPSLLRCAQQVQSDPNVQKLGSPGSFYRGDHLRQIHKAITARLKQFVEVYREFYAKELDPKQPMQDLRNRAIRTITMQSECAVFQQAWAHSVSVHERFCREMSAVKRRFHDAKWLVGYDCKIPVWDFRVASQMRIEQFCIHQQPLLGSKTIQVNDGFGVHEGILVRVFGKLETRTQIAELKGSTFFSIFIRERQVATCEFTKVWSSDGRFISEADPLETARVPKENRAYIEMKVNEIKPNQVIIDLHDSPSRRTRLCCKPLIEKIYQQLAAEVLLREDFLAIYTRVVGASELGYQSTSRALLTLLKNDSKPEVSSSTEKFSRLHDMEGNAALVSFAQEPTTWEEHFARHGYLLGNSTEPVLPKFITKNFETPVAAAATPTCSSS